MKPKLISGAMLLMIAACGPSAEDKAKAMMYVKQNAFESAMQDSEMVEAPNYLISEHHLKGKTKNVLEAIQFLEAYTREKKGYVESSETNSEIVDETEIQTSRDTLTNFKRYRMVTDLKLRIPYFLLDSALLVAKQFITFTDYRNLSNTNVANEIIGNQLIITEHEQKKNVGSEVQKIANNKELDQQEKARQEDTQAPIHAQVANLNLQDKIMYATLNVSLYENEKIAIDKQFIIKSVEPYEPNFFEKAWIEIKTGAQGFERFILFFVGMWTWILALFFMYKLFKNGYFKSLFHA